MAVHRNRQVRRSDRIAYEDRDVVAGASYSYRLGVMGPGGEIFAGETSITVPAPASLEMSRVALDAEGLLVEFALARSAPAALEVYDLSGRRRVLHRLEGLPAGSHRVVAFARHRVAPGAGARPPVVVGAWAVRSGTLRPWSATA